MKRCLDLPDPFEVVLVVDPVLNGSGYDPLGPYCESSWLPLLGPSAYLIARRFLQARGGTWSKGVLAASMGLGYNGGSNCPFERSLARLEGFHVAQVVEGTLLVKARWPRLSYSQTMKLPPELRGAESVMAGAA